MVPIFVHLTLASIIWLRKNQRDWRDKKQGRDMGRIDEEDAMMDEVSGAIEWYRISLSIPAGERHRRIEFQQAMLNKFMDRIPNFADKDVSNF